MSKCSVPGCPWKNKKVPATRLRSVKDEQIRDKWLSLLGNPAELRKNKTEEQLNRLKYCMRHFALSDIVHCCRRLVKRTAIPQLSDSRFPPIVYDSEDEIPSKLKHQSKLYIKSAPTTNTVDNPLLDSENDEPLKLNYNCTPYSKKTVPGQNAPTTNAVDDTLFDHSYCLRVDESGTSGTVHTDGNSPPTKELLSDPQDTTSCDLPKLQNSNVSIRIDLSLALDTFFARQVSYRSQNVVPEFDPDVETEHNFDIECWLSNVDVARSVYGWNDQTVVSVALSKLRGNALVWYKANKELYTNLYDWNEWKKMLRERFPKGRYSDYNNRLEEMLVRKKLPHETVDQYYTEKMRLLDACEITGRKAVACIIAGLPEGAPRRTARACCLPTPESLHRFLQAYMRPAELNSSSSIPATLEPEKQINEKNT